MENSASYSDAGVRVGERTNNGAERTEIHFPINVSLLTASIYVLEYSLLTILKYMRGR